MLSLHQEGGRYPGPPVRVVEHVQLQLAQTPPRAGGGGHRGSPLKRTPLRIKTPVHPLTHSNKAPVRRPVEESGIPSIGKEDGHYQSKQGIQGVEDERQVLEAGTGSHNEAPLNKSPPVATTKGILYVQP